MGLLLAGFVCFCGLSACAGRAAPGLTPQAPSGSAAPSATPTESPTPAPSPTDTLFAPGEAAAPEAATSTPVPSEDYLFVAVPTINPDNPLRFTFPTAAVFPTPLNWRPPLLSVPYSLGPKDHFWFARPIASDSVNYPLGSYRYGSNYFGQMSVHAGIDIDAPEGTPILAAGPGQVVWAGFGLFNFNPGYEKDPYGIAVAIEHDFGYNNQPVYTLYAHMRAENNLYVGQHVNTGDVLGWIGLTGNTTGYHLHFEVRVGKNNYFTTRNPELWIAPYSGWGILLGQVLDDRGRPVYGSSITIRDLRGRYVDALTTYGDRVANPDDQWHENFVDSDLPAGTYHIEASIGVSDTAQVVSGTVTLLAGLPHFVILQEGVGLIDPASPGQTATPPYPSDTPTYTPTPTSTNTPTPTRTPRPTRTPVPTRTPWLSPTPLPTLTRWPTWTLTPSITPRPTWSPVPSDTPPPSPTPLFGATDIPTSYP